MSDETFKLWDHVCTKKGAAFFGQIIAFDEDSESPGCTVRAYAQGFMGTKHVYPLAQLRHLTQQELFAHGAAMGTFSKEMSGEGFWKDK